MSSAFTPQQSYKSRAEAYRLFVLPQGLPVGKSKFYDDCVELKLLNQDKSVDLSSLVAYAKKLQPSASSGQSLAEKTRDQELADHELRKAKAEADLKEMQAENERRKMDEKWLHSDDAWAAVAGLMGMLRDTLRHQFNVGSPQLIHLASGDPVRAPEVYEGAEQILNKAFNEVVLTGRIEALFSEDVEQDEEL